MTEYKKPYETIKQAAEAHPDTTFNLIYDVWEAPESRNRHQVYVKGLSAKEMAEKYGNFEYDGSYTLSVNPSEIDVWATADKDHCYERNESEEIEK